LILEFVAGATANKELFFEQNIEQITGVREDSNYNYIIGWHHHEAASTATTKHKFANDTSTTNIAKITVAIKDDGTANYLPQVSPYETSCDVMTPYSGSSTLAYYDDGTKNVDPTSLITTIKGAATTYKAPTAWNPINPWFSTTQTKGFNVTSTGDTGKYLVFQTGLLNTFDLSSSNISFSTRATEFGVSNEVGARYIGLGSGDSANVATAAKLFQFESGDSKVRSSGVTGVQTYVIDPTRTGDEEYSTLSESAVTKLFMASWLDNTGQDFGIGFILKQKPIQLITGSATYPCNYKTAAEFAKSNMLNTVKDQGGSAAAQIFAAQDIQIGDGTRSTYWDSSFQAIEFPSAYNASDLDVAFNVGSANFLHNIKVKTGDTVNMVSFTGNMGDFHKWEYIYDFTSCSVLNATVTLRNKSNIDYSGLTFSGCKEITHNSANLSGGVTLSNCVDTYCVTVANETEFNNFRNCAFNGNNYSIKITGNHGGSTWTGTGMTVSGGTGSYDIRYEGTGTLTIEMDVGSGWTQPRAEATVGTLTISTPTISLTVTSNIAASDIKIFDTGTQTIEASTTGTSLVTTNAGTYDITVQKAGYLPQRQVGVVLGVSNVDVDVTLVEDPVYVSGHGLTYTTDLSYNRATKKLTLSTRQEGRDFYSALIDAFIAQSTLDNTPFDFQAVGPDSIFFVSDAEIIDSASEDNWKGAGIRYVNTAGTTTAEWSSVKSSGTIPAGGQGEFQQVAGSGTTDLRATGAVDQIIQIYGDAGHGNFDYRSHLVIKYQLNGYREERADVLALAGISTLEPFEYSVALQPVAIAAAIGDPAITITITDEGATPVTWNGKDFSITVQYTGAETGEQILREINYNLSLDATYQGKDPFNWPEMVLEAGSAYETIRGITEGGVGSTLKGVRVINGSGDPHPDFTRFQADDGTYFTPQVLSQINITGMPAVGGSIRLQISNETAKTAPTWAATTAYSLADKALRTTGVGSENTAGLYFVATTAGTTGGTEPVWNTSVGGTTNDGTVVWTTYAILYYDADPVGTSYADTYINGEEFNTGDTYRVRFAELNGATSFKRYNSTGLVSSGGFAVVVNAASDDVYATNAIDGSSTAVTDKFSPDYANNEIDLDTNSDFALTEAYAYYCYELTTSNGMYTAWEAVTAIDSANYRNNTAIFALFFDETAGFVKQTDNGRWYRDDGVRPARDPTTGGSGIEINWRNPVYLEETGVSGLTPTESAQLSEISTVNSKIGTPAATVSADIAVIDTNVDAVLLDTNELQTDWADGGRLDLVLDSRANQASVDVIDSNVDAVKLKTDQLTFTKANELDSNTKSVNDGTVTGTGTEGDEWGPV
jgi:hypothetical protein